MLRLPPWRSTVAVAFRWPMGVSVSQPNPLGRKIGGRKILAAACCNSPGAYQPGRGGPCACQSQAHQVPSPLVPAPPGWDVADGSGNTLRHTAQSFTAARSEVSASRFGRNSWPTKPLKPVALIARMIGG